MGTDAVNSTSQFFNAIKKVSGNKCALGVMAKVPTPGNAKTRLVPPLTNFEAATLSACFIRDTGACIATAIDVLRNTTNEARGVAVFTPADSESVLADYMPDNFQFLAQRGETLGERLLSATADLFARGFESVCLINSDSPTLPRAYLVETVARLSRAGDRVVLGAADDGGYYLIGVKKAHRQLFERIEWSTSKVLTQTLERAAEIELEVEVLPVWYDVDDAASLERLCMELFSSTRNNETGEFTANHTRAYLSALMAREGCERICPSLAVDNL